MMASLPFTSGPARYEAVIHNNLLVFVCLKGCMQGMVWSGPDKCETTLHAQGQAQYVEGVYVVV